MTFKDRAEAGELLSQLLQRYKNKKVVVYAIPRGGVETAVKIAENLNASLDIVITRKICHPNNPEYAIAAVAEDGHLVSNRSELSQVDEKWFEEAVAKQRLEAKRRREIYVGNSEQVSPEGMIAIIVDDGVATGLTLKAGIKELKHKHPKKLIVAVPIITKGTLDEIKNEVDQVVSLTIPAEDMFRGSIASYYKTFDQIDDKRVVDLIDTYEKNRILGKQDHKFFIKRDKEDYGFFDFDEP